MQNHLSHTKLNKPTHWRHTTDSTSTWHRAEKGKSFSQKRLETLQTQTCSSSVPAWAPGPAARRAARPAGSWPGRAWPSARSNYLHGLAWWRWISETPPRSPGQKHQRILNGHYWLQKSGENFIPVEKMCPQSLEERKQDWLSLSCKIFEFFF